MLSKILKPLFGSRNDRLLKQLHKVVGKINALESNWQALSNTDLQAKTSEFREHLAQGASLETLIPEAFATVREASRRVLNMRHFDVQLIGGLVLNNGQIAEMRTGEGKTLVATLAAYLNALVGQGVHIVTVNDYLAARDAEWMGPLYQFLGLTVGTLKADMPITDRRAAYQADITYGTNNEFGFDYLRDNMALKLEDKVQREHYYANVDEVDSILIDEARTPLIISGPSDEGSDYYALINQIILQLKKGHSTDSDDDFTIDEKTKQVYLTEEGHQRLETLLIKAGLLEDAESLYSNQHISLMYHVAAALRAHHVFKRDVDYIVRQGQVVIVDEHTGRLMSGRRWSEGLHQAVEAKEGVQIQAENHTLASITFQNYFRLYQKLSGMTGTADTEAYEFHQIYGLEVVVIPTHQPVRRLDFPDKIYLTEKEKFNAIVEEIEACLNRNQPVLVGTTSVENSEILSELLQKKHIPHQVLNAKRHEQEAKIIAEAGRPKMVTIATNMAARGTDIVLGGNLKAELAALADEASESEREACKMQWEERYNAVVQAGGLHIIGSERHESRRIDNQLRGRAGRQGDPGSSRFYLSLQDNLLRIFAAERLTGMMQRLGLKEGEAIEHPWITRAIENAQKKVEGYHFDVRKQLLEYDDVSNEQRKIIYQQRQALLVADEVYTMIEPFWKEVFSSIVQRSVPPNTLEETWDINGLNTVLQTQFNLHLPLENWLKEHEENEQETTEATFLIEKITQAALTRYLEKEAFIGAPSLRTFEKTVMLQTLDRLWKEHLSVMDYLRQGIHLRGFAQKNPKQEYKREAFDLFAQLLQDLKYHIISILSSFTWETIEHLSKTTEGLIDAEYSKVGRNQKCPCGSDKKFKHCHGSFQV